MPGKHALLSASSSKRWMNCPPSARMCEDYEDTTSDFAAEGTEAHALCEHLLKTALDRKSTDPSASFRFYSDEMQECATGYVAYIMEQVEAAKQRCADPLVLIEQRLDFTRFVQEGFGTGDCVIIADGALQIVDYKHGTGILVEAEGNPQMRLYALGALELFDGIYDIDQVSMTIYQPRRANVSTETLPKSDLYRWAEEILKPAAELAYKGEGDLACGDWCRFCKAKAECRKRAEHNLELAQYDFKMPVLLDTIEIAAILDRVDELVNWAGDIKEYALQSAISGAHYDGWKLVEGRANRRYTNEEAIVSAVNEAGFDPYEHKLLGITAMERLLGKKQFSTMLGDYVEHPQGKPTLVPMTDKRPEMNNAKNDFDN